MRKAFSRLMLFGVPVAVIVGFVILFGVLGATAPQPEKAEPVARPSAVFVTEAAPSSVQLHVRTQGEVVPMTEIDLITQVSGRIAYVNPDFVQGGFFNAGETLVRLESADYQLAVTRAEAQVAQARQGLIREEAEADLALEEWEALGSGEASALTLRQPQMAEAQAQLDAAEASLAEARLNLQRTRISAPFDGRVRAKNADIGQYVGPGSALGRVFATDRVEVRLPMTDNELGTLGIPLAFQASDDTPAPRADLYANVAGQMRHWVGEVVRTDSAIDSQTRTLNAIIEVTDPYGAAAEAAGAPLAIGLFVSAEVIGQAIDYAYALPRSALRGENMVYVANLDGTLSIRTVSVADSNSQRVIITSGITQGERIVTSPLRAAAEGMLIRALDQNGDPLDTEPETDNSEESEDAAVAEQVAAARAG